MKYGKHDQYNKNHKPHSQRAQATKIGKTTYFGKTQPNKHDNEITTKKSNQQKEHQETPQQAETTGYNKSRRIPTATSRNNDLKLKNRYYIY
jgi:hypothetical protein